MTATRARARAVFLNAGRINFDNRINFARLQAAACLTNHEASSASEPATILERVQAAI